MEIGYDGFKGIRIRDEIGMVDQVGDVEGEPGIDTNKVEHMSTFGDELEGLVILELAKKT